MLKLLIALAGLSLTALTSGAKATTSQTTSATSSQTTASSSSQSSSSNVFDVSTILTTAGGIVGVGGLGLASTVFWKHQRAKTDNKPIKTIPGQTKTDANEDNRD